MNDLIVRTRDIIGTGSVQRNIFGLNLLPDKNADYGTSLDPRLIFLRALVSAKYSSAIIYNRADGANYLTEHFVEAQYQNVPNSMIAGELICPSASAEYTGMFFPKIEAEFFTIVKDWDDRENSALAFSLLYSDGITLLVSPERDDFGVNLSKVLASPLVTSNDFIIGALESYQVVLNSRADGDYFACYAKQTSDFSVIEYPLAIAIEAIRQTEWFRDSKNSLVWDEEYSMCLVENTMP